MVLIIDNYDSFVFNLARYAEELGHEVHVVRNDNITIADIEHLNPTHIIISPGPCGPHEAGMSIDIVRHFTGKIPILGICLGHQIIGHVFGGKVVHAQQPLHGQSSLIQHDGTGIFHGLPSPLKVGRYHSLIVDDENLNPNITVTSRSDEGEMMSMIGEKWRLVGLQFHPESILTEHGHVLINNFLINSGWMKRTSLHAIQKSISKNIYDWLTLPNNLTETIKKTGAEFSLTLFSQSIGTPYNDEITTLQRAQDLALIRRVILNANHHPMIFARVIVPRETYLNYQHEFDTLGNSPIGNALLYGNKKVIRSEFEYSLLSKENPIFQDLKQIHPISMTYPYWTRRSTFHFPKGELIISEVFLENIPDYPHVLCRERI